MKLYTPTRCKTLSSWKLFQNYPTWIYFHRSVHNEFNGVNKFQIEGWVKSYRILKSENTQMPKKEIWHTMWAAHFSSSTIHLWSAPPCALCVHVLPFRLLTPSMCATCPCTVLDSSACASNNNWVNKESFRNDGNHIA